MLHFEAGARFDCHQCGLCCRTDWKIRVEPLEAERLNLDPEDSTLPVDSGQCQFLTEKDLCSVHGLRPVACRVFPFVIHKLPDGYHVGVSHYCPSARGNQGRLVSEHFRDLSALVEQTDLPDLVTGPIPIWEGSFTGWTGYQMFEEALLCRLGEPELLRWVTGNLLSGHKEWGRCSMDDFFRPNDVVSEEAVRAAGRELAAQLGAECLGQTSWSPRSLIKSLIHRKVLITQPNLVEGLALLSILPQAVSWFRDPEEGVGVLELELSHGLGLTLAARRLVENAVPGD